MFIKPHLHYAFFLFYFFPEVLSTLARFYFASKCYFFQFHDGKKKSQESHNPANLLVSFTLNGFLATAIAFPNRGLKQISEETFKSCSSAQNLFFGTPKLIPLFLYTVR